MRLSLRYQLQWKYFSSRLYVPDGFALCRAEPVLPKMHFQMVGQPSNLMCSHWAHLPAVFAFWGYSSNQVQTGAAVCKQILHNNHIKQVTVWHCEHLHWKLDLKSYIHPVTGQLSHVTCVCVQWVTNIDYSLNSAQKKLHKWLLDWKIFM